MRSPGVTSRAAASLRAVVTRGSWCPFSMREMVTWSTPDLYARSRCVNPRRSLHSTNLGVFIVTTIAQRWRLDNTSIECYRCAIKVNGVTMMPKTVVQIAMTRMFRIQALEQEVEALKTEARNAEMSMREADYQEFRTKRHEYFTELEKIASMARSEEDGTGR